MNSHCKVKRKKCDFSMIQLEIIGENKMFSVTAVNNGLYNYGTSN